MRETRELDPPRGSTGTGVRWVLVGAGVLFVSVVAFGAVSLLTAPMRSTTGVVNRTLNPDNVIATYERFHDRAKGFEARLAQVRGTSRLWQEETDAAERGRLGIELRAQRQSCREIAAGYNAEASMTNRAVFQGRQAPERLDETRCEQ